MGRSSGYCFKIIACGGSSESVDRDDLDASSENKVSTDKRGWSFRKKSSGHRVLSNTVITEIPSSDDKKSSENVIINSEAIISEKTSTNQWIETEEFSRVSTSTTKDNLVVTNLVTKSDDEDGIKFDSSPDESSIIVIQASVRKFLAQREISRLKNVVKLQAVVRGHLVRCHAAGTLRVIQAIVKMQTLVRVLHSKISIGEKGIQDSNTNRHPTYISMEKLLSNTFANQVIESTPRTKQINIKCDPSKQDPTWKWLERWTSVSSPEVKPLTTAPTPPETTVTEAEPPKRPAKRAATEQADSEGRKSVFGSRKPSNPSFIAAQSKFEELTSKTTEPLAKTGEPPAKTGEPAAKTGEPPAKTVEPPAKTSEPPVYAARTAGSECGTELSVTSMLDSPDPSESGNPKILDATESTHSIEDHAPLGTESTHSIEDHVLLGTELTHSIEIPPETNINQMTKSPLEPEPSPRTNIQYSERTPSSVVNNTNTKTRSDGKASSEKKTKKLLSPISRGSLENLPKEGRNGKRRNSFGSQSSEIDHQEARDSSSSNSGYIPSYMQVTESARAKALNSSPRLSPDVQGKDAYLKKRHSMPGAVNSRHDSPRLKRSSPQSQQTTKGNENRERKWQS